MSEPTNDLPRYTWVYDRPFYRVFRRVGLYGQEPVISFTTPGAESDASRREGAEIANAVREYLDNRDRERREAGR